MDAQECETVVARAEALADDHTEMMASLLAIRRNGLTQAEVAERMGVTQPTVAELERYDANPTLSTVRRYALAVGADISTKVQKVNPGTNGCPQKIDAVVQVADDLIDPGIPPLLDAGAFYETREPHV